MLRSHHDCIARHIADAIIEINGKHGRAIPVAPRTVLVGETGFLDSLGLVTLAVMLEQRVQETFGQSIGVIDLILAGDTDECTIASLGEMIAAEVDRVAAA